MSLLKGSGIPQPTRAVPGEPEGMRSRLVRKSMTHYVGPRQNKQLMAHMVRFPSWHRDHLYGDYRFIKDAVDDWDRTKPRSFFGTFTELGDLGGNQGNQTNSKAIVYYVHNYWVWSHYLLALYVQAIQWLSIRNFPISERTMSQLKWSTLNKLLSQVQGMPYHSGMLNSIIANLGILVDDSPRTGISVVMPLLMGPDDNWSWEPLPRAVPGGGSSDIARYTRRMPTLHELNSNSLYRQVDYAGTIGTLAAATRLGNRWDNPITNPGLIGEHLLGMIIDVQDQFLARFKYNPVAGLNVTHPECRLAEFMVEDMGRFDSTLKPNEFTKMCRSAPIYDASSYFENNLGYLKYPAPILRSRLTRNEVAERFEFDPSIPGRQLLDDFDNPDFVNLDYHLDTGTLIGTALVAGGVQAACDIPSLPFVAIGGMTDDRIREISAQSRWLEGLDITDYSISGWNTYIGALDPTILPADVAADYYRNGGTYQLLTQYARLSNSGSLWTAKEGEVVDLIRSDPNWMVNRVDVDSGIFRPMWKVTPWLDPFDPYVHGVFPVLSAENRGQRGEWSDIFALRVTFQKGGADDEPVANVPASTPVDGDQIVWSLGSDAIRDVVGPFIGRSVALTPNLHFSQKGAARYTVDGNNPDDGLGSIPAIPVLPFDVGITHDDFTDGEQSLNGVAYDMQEFSFGMSNTINNDIDTTAIIDMRLYSQGIWDVRANFSLDTPYEEQLEDFVFEGFSRVPDMTQTPDAASLVPVAGIPSATSAEISPAVSSSIDVFIQRAGDRREGGYRTGGKSHDTASTTRSNPSSDGGRSRNPRKPKFAGKQPRGAKETNDPSTPVGSFDPKVRTQRPDELGELTDREIVSKERDQKRKKGRR